MWFLKDRPGPDCPRRGISGSALHYPAPEGGEGGVETQLKNRQTVIV